MKIVVYDRLEEDLQQMIQKAADGYTVVFPESEEALKETGFDAEIFYGFCHERIFQFLPSLKWIQSSSAGMDNHLYPALRDSKVLLTNAAGLYGSHVADQGFALLLGLTRGIQHFVRNQDQKVWGGSKSPMVEIGGLTIGIVGMGGIGQYMASRAKGFDMYVISVDAYRNDAQIGTISLNGTGNVSYDTSSDIRLKENITALTGSLARIIQIKPSSFNFISEPDRHMEGFIAHELQEVVPIAVTGERDGMYTKGEHSGSMNPQGVDYSRVTPLLTGAVQELVDEVKFLRAAITGSTDINQLKALISGSTFV